MTGRLPSLGAALLLVPLSAPLAAAPPPLPPLPLPPATSPPRP